MCQFPPSFCFYYIIFIVIYPFPLVVLVFLFSSVWKGSERPGCNTQCQVISPKPKQLICPKLELDPCPIDSSRSPFVVYPKCVFGPARPKNNGLVLLMDSINVQKMHRAFLSKKIGTLSMRVGFLCQKCCSAHVKHPFLVSCEYIRWRLNLIHVLIQWFLRLRYLKMFFCSKSLAQIQITEPELCIF